MTAPDTSAPPLDLDAIEARAAFYAADPWDGAEMSADDVPALVAEVHRLRALRDDIADAFDGLVMKVWRAAGEEHEPPADVAALLARVAAARREGAEAMREACAAAVDTAADACGVVAWPFVDAVRALSLPEAPQ